jgi:hypothetical protein
MAWIPAIMTFIEKNYEIGKCIYVKTISSESNDRWQAHFISSLKYYNYLFEVQISSAPDDKPVSFCSGYLKEFNIYFYVDCCHYFYTCPFRLPHRMKYTSDAVFLTLNNIWEVYRFLQPMEDFSDLDFILTDHTKHLKTNCNKFLFQMKSCDDFNDIVCLSCGASIDMEWHLDQYYIVKEIWSIWEPNTISFFFQWIPEEVIMDIVEFVKSS